MMKQNIFLIGINVFFLVHISCNLTEAADKPKKISIGDFPMTVGSQWTYVRTDTLANGRTRPPIIVVETETVAVQITKTDKRKKKGIISEWVRSFSSKVDTQYVVVKRDSLKVIASMEPGRSDGVFQFLFPLKVGKSWSGPLEYPGLDSYLVMPTESITVSAGNFSNACLITRKTWNPNNPGEVKYWVVRKIGIVKIKKWDQLFGEYTSENWDLIKYDIRE